MVLAMLRELPAHSRWASWFHDPDRGDEFRERFGLNADGDGTDEEADAEEQPVDWYFERRYWNDERMIAAAMLNRLQDLIRLMPVQWPEGEPPEFSTVGPAEWRGEEPHKKDDEPEPVRDPLLEVMRVFGYTGPASASPQPVSDEEYSGATVDDVLAVFGYRQPA